MTQIPHLATQDALLAWPAIEPIVGMKKTKRDSMIKEGTFPAPIPMGPKMNRWPASAIDKWMREQLARATPMKDKARELAREAAVDCGERHDYMPATPLLAEVWEPHRWVVDAMLLAAHEAETERDRYRAGNTELLGILMKFVAGEHTEPLKKARDILLGIGLIDSEGLLNWQALEDRKPKQKSWTEAVNECVTDPAARERLLALDEPEAGRPT